LAKKNEPDKAMEDYNKVIELNPSYGVAYSSRGDIYLQMEDFDNALKDYNKALEIDPNNKLAKEGKAWVLSIPR